MPRRPDSNALRLLRDQAPAETPQSLIASARRHAPAASVITAYPIEPVEQRTAGGNRYRRHSARGDSIVAAAERLNGTEERGGRQTPRRRKRQAEKWQNEVWELRDESPEMRFLGDRKARAAAQCRIYIGHHKAGDVGEPARVTEGVVGELAQQLFGNLPDVEQKLKRYVQQIEYTGESIINTRNDAAHPGRLVWSVHSSSELVGSQAGQYQLTDGVTPRKVDDANEILARSWTPHPKLAALADAPVRALLPVLRELVQMTKYVGAQIDSKLASGGGLLLVTQDVEILNKDGEKVDFATELTEYMMTAIEDRSSAESLAPLVASVPRIEGVALSDLIHLQTFSETLDPHMHERRAEAIRRIALGMDSDPGVLDGMGTSNHWCKTADHEVFTKDRGWVTHDQLLVGDMVQTLNHETGLSEWQPVQAVYRADVVDEPMLAMRSASHASVSTAGHRWPIVKSGRKVSGGRRRWTTSGAGFAAADRVPVAARSVSWPDTPKYTDDMVKLIAAYTADGTLLHYRSGTEYVRIAKFEDREINELRAVLQSVFGGATEHDHPTATANGTAFVIGHENSRVITDIACGKQKVVSRDFVQSLTESQAELFLHSMIRLGDGVVSGGARIYYQSDARRLDAIEMAAIMLGYKVTCGQRNQQTGFGTEPLHWVRVSGARDTFSPRDCDQTWESYTGVVWCPTTPNGTWLCRYDGHIFYTGNSAWQVDESEVKLGINPIMTTFCHTMTAEVVRPLLAASGVENADEFSVWFDTSALKLRPDRSKDAQWAYQQGILSAEKTLIESGFDTGDMPTDEERAGRVLRENLIALLSQFGQQPGSAVEILRAIGVDLPATAVPDTESDTPAVDAPTVDATAADPDNSPPATLDKPIPKITPGEGTP